MRHIAESLTIGLAALLATTATPRAADWAVGSGGVIKDYGSIKDYKNAAVPVPAPTPAPQQFADWYVRADIGYNLATSSSINTSGGITARNGEDLSGYFFGGIGAGRYLTPSIRADFNFDFRPKKVVTSGPQYFTAIRKQSPSQLYPLFPTYTDISTYAVTHTDDSGTADQTAMINLYYDFHTASRFTPYIGAGIGLDFKRYKRATTQNSTCVGTQTVDQNGVQAGYAAGSCPTPATPVTGFQSDHYTSALGVAVAVMAGGSYRVSEGVAIDAGYRLMWEGASLGTTSDGINGATNIRLSDRLDHEIRTGVRIDLN